MKQIISLFYNHDTKLKVSDFKIFKLEDFFKNVDKDIINKTHKVDFYVLIIITENTGKHTINFEEFTYSKGTVLSIRKDQIHQFHSNKNSKGYLLFFREEFLNKFLNDEEITKAIQMFNELLVSPKTQLKDKDYDSVLSIVKHIEKEFSQSRNDYSFKIIRSYLHILITIIHRVKSLKQDVLKFGNYLNEFIKFQNLVEKNYTQSKSVNFYSDKLGFSTKKLNTIVKQISDKTAKSFIDDVVVIKAKRQLIHSNVSIKEVAYLLGFKQSTNFFNFFKKHTNYTPEAYRKLHKA